MKSLASMAYSDERLLYYQSHWISHYISLKRLGECTFWSQDWKGKRCTFELGSESVRKLPLLSWGGLYCIVCVCVCVFCQWSCEPVHDDRTQQRGTTHKGWFVQHSLSGYHCIACYPYNQFWIECTKGSLIFVNTNQEWKLCKWCSSIIHFPIM